MKYKIRIFIKLTNVIQLIPFGVVHNFKVHGSLEFYILFMVFALTWKKKY